MDHTELDGRAGLAPFRKWQTWYMVFGDLKCGSPPVIAIHGGPAGGSENLEVLGPLYETAGIPVVVYDQVGCGRSTHLPDEPQSTFTIEFFLEELQNLLAHLDIETYHLLGHSWGGMLSLEHAVRKPAGLRKIILVGTPASTELVLKAQDGCWQSLGEKYYKAAVQYDRDGIPTDDFQKAGELFQSTFLSRLKPFPQTIINGLKNIYEAANVNDALWGTQKVLDCTGSLKTWSSIDRLHLISNEVFVTTGEFDYCGGEALSPFLNGSLNAKFVKFPDAGHMAHMDAGNDYIASVAEFLKNSL